MSPADPFRPGDHRAGATFSGAALVDALVRVEAAWAVALEDHGLLPDGAAAAVSSYRLDDLEALATEAEAGGNPLIPLLKRLRTHVEETVAGAGEQIHAGLTSQDVLDSALMVLACEAVDTVTAQLQRQLDAVADLARAHRDTPMLARTLGQPARASVFGLRVLGWYDDLRNAHDALRSWRESAPVQLGGPVGDLAEAGALLGADLGQAPTSTAERLGLSAARPWHTSRSPVTRLGNALVAATDAWGHVANDVLLMSRSELGELSEPGAPGRGGSSSMPHKHNPVLSVLLRRTSLDAPLLLAQLHLAAAGSEEERSAGPWHTEWPALRNLCRQSVAAADQATELVTGLEVHADRMRANLAAADVPAPDARGAQLIDQALDER